MLLIRAAKQCCCHTEKRVEFRRQKWSFRLNDLLHSWVGISSLVTESASGDRAILAIFFYYYFTTFHQAAIILWLYYTILMGACTVDVRKPAAVLAKPPTMQKEFHKWQVRNFKHPATLKKKATKTSIFSYHTVCPAPHPQIQPLPPLSWSNCSKICMELNCWRFTPLHNAHIRGCSPLTYG